MNRYLKFVVAAAMLLCGGASGVAAREVYNISAGWTFFTADTPSTDEASSVNLPHVQATATTLNYLKQIDVPINWEGRRVFLRIGGAARVADIFVDGKHTATHRGANSAFTVEITRRLQPGTPATVRIVVESSPSLDVLPTAGREKIYGGIFRGVELIVCDPLSISPAASFGTGENDFGSGDGVWITTDRLSREKAVGRVRLSLLTPDVPQPGTMARVRFRDADGDLAAQSAMPVTTPVLDIPFTLSDPHLWQGVEDPYLYSVEVTLLNAEGMQTDSMTVNTGFRSVAVDAEGNLTLNGRPTKLHGVILPRDRSVVGTALTPFQIEEDIDFIREMGANAVRVAGGQHSDYFYSLCDEAGLMVWNDGPFTGAAYPVDMDFVDTRAFRENGRAQLGEMISQLYNHPSVAIWGVFSNVTARGGDPVPYIRELDSMVRGLDGSRLTAASSVSDGEVNFITDLISFDLAIGWDSGLPDGVTPWLEQLRAGWPYLRAGISYGAGASIFNQSERLERPLPGSAFHPEGWQTFFHEEYVRRAVDAPGLWGVFVANMFDSGAAKTPAGVLTAAPASEGGIDDRGLVTFDRKDRKDAFWIYKAVWNTTEPFVRIAGGRLDGRADRRQTIHVYSNLPEVELFVGGRSQGRRTGESGIFEWSDLNLRGGLNRLEARASGATATGVGSGVVTHRVSLNINPGAATTAQPATPQISVATPVSTPPVSATSIGSVGIPR